MTNWRVVFASFSLFVSFVIAHVISLLPNRNKRAPSINKVLPSFEFSASSFFTNFSGLWKVSYIIEFLTLEPKDETFSIYVIWVILEFKRFSLIVSISFCLSSSFFGLFNWTTSKSCFVIEVVIIFVIFSISFGTSNFETYSLLFIFSSIISSFLLIISGSSYKFDNKLSYLSKLSNNKFWSILLLGHNFEHIFPINYIFIKIFCFYNHWNKNSYFIYYFYNQLNDNL